MKTALFSSIAALLLTVTSAPAALLTQSQNTGLLTPEFTTRLSNFNRFDPALGTLNSVTVTATQFLVNTGLWSNFSGSPQTFTTQMFSDLQVLSPTHLILIHGELTTGPISAAANANGPFSNGGSNSPGPQTYTDALTLNIFTGPANVAFDLQTSLTTFSISNSSISLLPTLNESATIELTYNYTPVVAVPEPGTIALAALGIAGLLARRRR